MSFTNTGDRDRRHIFFPVIGLAVCYLGFASDQDSSILYSSYNNLAMGTGRVAFVTFKSVAAEREGVRMLSKWCRERTRSGKWGGKMRAPSNLCAPFSVRLRTFPLFLIPVPIVAKPKLRIENRLWNFSSFLIFLPFPLAFRPPWKSLVQHSGTLLESPGSERLAVLGRLTKQSGLQIQPKAQRLLELAQYNQLAR